MKNILFICPNWVGDLVMATNVFEAVRASYPKANITFLLKPGYQHLVAGAPWCDNWIIYDKKKEHRGIRGFLGIYHTLKKHSFDLTIILPNSIRSGILGFLSRAKLRLGYDRFLSSILLTHKVERPKDGKKKKPIYMGEYYRDLLPLIQIPLPSLKLNLPLSDNEAEIGKKLWTQATENSTDKKILLIPGASFGGSKLWPTEYFATAVDLIHETMPSSFLISVGPGEEKIAQKIKELAKANISIVPSDAGGLSALKGVVASSDLMITNDTGPRHIGNAFGKPMVVLIGSTNPLYTETPEEESIVLRDPSVSCSPCHLKQCPFSHHACMKNISPEQVVQAVKQLLG